MADWVLTISGMSCGSCVLNVTEALEEIAGVESAVVTLDPQRAEITGPGAKEADLLKAVVDAGFSATVSS
jgi:copper chaperone